MPRKGERVEDDERVICPVCAGAGVLLGDLGALRWFRCRDCGIEFSEDVAAGVGLADEGDEGEGYGDADNVH